MNDKGCSGKAQFAAKVSLQADVKKARKTCDSFSLFEQRKSEPSEPYIMDDLLLDPTFNYPPKSNENSLTSRQIGFKR